MEISPKTFSVLYVFLKIAVRGILLTLLFAVVSLLAIIFLKTQVYPTVNDNYKPTISVNEVENLSNTEIVEKLLTRYLEHYKDKPIFNDQRIADYKVIAVSEVKYVTDGTTFAVLYAIRQHFWNEYWQIGKYEPDGMIRKFHYVSLIKENNQFTWKDVGTAPPIPK